MRPVLVELGRHQAEKIRRFSPTQANICLSETGTGRAPAGPTKCFPRALALSMSVVVTLTLTLTHALPATRAWYIALGVWLCSTAPAGREDGTWKRCLALSARCNLSVSASSCVR